jgi:hypothetical protein
MGERIGSDDAERSAHNDALMFVKGSDYSVIRFLWSQGK